MLKRINLVSKMEEIGQDWVKTVNCIHKVKDIGKHGLRGWTGFFRDRNLYKLDLESVVIKIQKVSKRPLGNQLGQTSTYLLILEGRPMANKQNKLRIISEVSLICGFLITCKSRVVLSDLWVGGRQIPCQSVILLYLGWDVCNKMEKRGNVPSHKGASPESVNISNTQNNSHIWFKII